jgi:hypothetical protein
MHSLLPITCLGFALRLKALLHTSDNQRPPQLRDDERSGATVSGLGIIMPSQSGMCVILSDLKLIFPHPDTGLQWQYVKHFVYRMLSEAIMHVMIDFKCSTTSLIS